MGTTGGSALVNPHGAETGDAGRSENHSEPAPTGAGPGIVRGGIYLAFLVALVTYLVSRYGLNTIFAVAVTAFGLGLVVFIHELGHFLVAKWCDVHVETFSIGFGPALPGCSFRWGETTYMIGVVPLGGYVKMVGEGDGEEGDEDPRSFKNKPVWQRMAIISAGVTMNLILAFACFVFVFRTRGDEQLPGIIDRVDTGGPAWQVGARTGDVIELIGNRGPYPSFNALMPVVMNSQGAKLQFVFGPPNAPESEMTHTEVQPQRHPGDASPMIGIGPPSQLRLWPADQLPADHAFPFLRNSAAAAANPPFECEDSIIATTDPANPGKVKALPPDPRNPKNLDFFEFRRRLTLLAGKEIVVEVRRKGHKEPVQIKVPPAWYDTFGLRMRMGKVTALRNGSPAMKAGVQPGDIIDQVEVRDDGGRTTRFGTFADKPSAPEGVTQKSLDPVRLPYELGQWATQQRGAKTVSLRLLRTNPPPADSNPNNHQERQRIQVSLGWDDSWRFNEEDQMHLYSPTSIPELGIAYQVETTIVAVDSGSPAMTARIEKAGELKYSKDDVIMRDGQRLTAPEGATLQLEEGDTISLKSGDVIKACQYLSYEDSSPDKFKHSKWIKLESDQWAKVFLVDIQSVSLSKCEVKKLFLRLDRGQLEVSLTSQPDKSWPLVERGILLQEDRRLVKAATIGQALGMGLVKTYDFVNQIFGSLRSLVTGRVSPDVFAGPLLIAKAAYMIAAKDIYDFTIFLGMIGVNLAVINFLPVPVLDGGHMVFLVYEKLRGRPAPEQVRVAATYVGLALIVCLMVAVVYLDVSRL
jgi:regulator of sigma E protease